MNDAPSAAQLARFHAVAFHDQRPWSETEFQGLLANKHCHLVSEPHGFALIRVIADEAELLTISVDPQKQKSGRGRALLERAIALATTLGAEKIFLEVAADNHAAIHLYATSGFSTVGKRSGYYVRANATPVDAVVMSRALT